MEVFKAYPTLIVMMPVLLGLKCCLELTLASRLSTAFHKKLLAIEYPTKRSRLIQANIGVVLIQAIAVAVMASLFTLVYSGLVLGNWLNFRELIILFGSSILSAYLAAFILACFTAWIILQSTNTKLNPDNISGPLVTSIGDLLALLLLAATSSFCQSYPFLGSLCSALVIFTLPYCWRLASSEKSTRSVLQKGWTPVIGNLFLSCCAGVCLESGIEGLSGGLTLLVPLVNGTGGNVSGIYSSRMATALHKGKEGTNRSTIQTLLFAHMITHLSFIIPVTLFWETTRLSFTFVVVYLTVVLGQVYPLLLAAKHLAYRAWEKGLDPDNHVVCSWWNLSNPTDALLERYQRFSGDSVPCIAFQSFLKQEVPIYSHLF